MIQMQIKWERNSRALALEAQGKIKGEDIIPHTTTDKFPPEMATVRMVKVSDKIPNVTIHIRGKSKQRTYSWNNTTYECANTCRVNVANSWTHGMSSSGELDEDYDWQDVHKIAEEVKETMGLN